MASAEASVTLGRDGVRRRVGRSPRPTDADAAALATVAILANSRNAVHLVEQRLNGIVEQRGSVAVETAARVARKQFEEIDATGNCLGDRFAVAALTPRR